MGTKGNLRKRTRYILSKTFKNSLQVAHTTMFCGCALCKDCLENFWSVIEHGRFTGYARGCAVLNVLLLLIVPVLCIATSHWLPVVTTVLLFIYSVILGVLELPFFCIRCSQCRILASIVSVFEIYWIRAVLYSALAVILISIATQVDKNNPATWYFGIILLIIAILYFTASCKGEKSTLDETSCTNPNNLSESSRKAVIEI